MHNTFLFIIILIVAVALVLSPMMRMLPSKREKAQMKLRQIAMKLGMQTKLCVLPSSDRSKARPTQPNGMTYRLTRTTEQLKRFQQHMTYRVIRDEQPPHDWLWFDQDNRRRAEGSSAICTLLDAMPADIVAFESTAQTSAVFWREKGSEQDVETIFHTLQQIQQLEANGRQQ